ncbi:hypothetical protein OSU72_01300 [Streptomyces sp. NA13]|nr:hypothetical protein OSU72_01300 [Streptomyces sp. NA13]
MAAAARPAPCPGRGLKAWNVRAVESVKGVLEDFDSWRFFQGESVENDAMTVLLGTREDGTPYLRLFRDGLCAGGEVDQGDDDRAQGTAAFGEDVRVADRVGPVRAPFQQAVGDQGAHRPPRHHSLTAGCLPASEPCQPP